MTIDSPNDQDSSNQGFENQGSYPGPDDLMKTIGPGQGSAVIDSHNWIGPYRVLKKLGEGGMGAVFLAEQEHPIRRQVAIKVIKSGRDSSEVISRFEGERQALALMQHPNIAQVLDAGTTYDGSPFFAMELVDGVPLTTYCDENKLSIHQRLSLFVHVCKAVQHAHQKGIIHRDLKPSNVLVTVIDGDAIPKVIDFGLAKATGQQPGIADATAFTAIGQIIGTLQYMSPEQAKIDNLDIDTRTDIYSLGVMLYELLTGSTPLVRDDLNKNAILKVLEIIREREPQRPSIRLSSVGLTASDIGSHRQIAPNRLLQILRGELDWIVMKALDKDRNRRYHTAEGFADDIQRFITNRPVKARPPSTSYRLQKFIKQHAGLVFTGIFTIATLATASVVSVSYAVQAERDHKSADEAREVANLKSIDATRERDRAERERIAQAKVTRLLTSILDAGDPVFGNVVSSYAGPFGSIASMRDVIKQATDGQLNDTTDLIDVPRIRIQLLNTLGDVNMSYGEVALSKAVFEKSEQLCIASNIDSGPDYIKTQMAIGICDYLFGELALSRARLEHSLQKFDEEVSRNKIEADLIRDSNLAKFVLAAIAIEHDDFSGALTSLQQVMQANPITSTDMPMLIEFARLLSGMVKIYESEVKGEANITTVLKAIGSMSGTSSAGLNSTLFEPFANAMGAEIIYATTGLTPYPAHLAMHDHLVSALGPDHFLTAISIYALAVTSSRLNDYDQASKHYDELIRLVDNSLGRKHPRFAVVLHSYARLLQRQWKATGRTNHSILLQAKTLCTEALMNRTQSLGSHRLTSKSAAFLNEIEQDLQRHNVQTP